MELFTQDHNYAGRGAIISEPFKVETKERVLNYTKEWIEDCLRVLGEHASIDQGIPIILFNPLSWERLEVIEIPKEILPEEFFIVDAQGNQLLYEKTKNNVRLEISLPPIGYEIVYVRRNFSPMKLKKGVYIEKSENTLNMENKFYRVQISLDSGEIISIFDKEANQDLLEPGKHLGSLKFYTEEGTDVAERSTPLEINWNLARREVSLSVEEGELSKSILVKRNLGIFRAQVEDRITLYRDIKRIDIDTSVFWGGARLFQLRYLFPFRKDLSIINYGVPFYTVRYPETVEGIKGPWKSDEILFEDWQHIREVANWIDLANGKFGVTLSSLSSSYYIKPGDLEAVLFRTVNSCGDTNYYYNIEYKKKLNFKFSITSGAGDWKLRKAYQRALEMLTPIWISFYRRSDSYPRISEKTSFLKFQSEGVVLTSIQPERNGILIRYYEAEGKERDVILEISNKKYRFFQETDMMGNPIRPKSIIKDGIISLKTYPYEIKTLLIMD